MNHLTKLLISGAILALPLLTAGCYYETYPNYRHYRSASYYDDDGYYHRETNYRVSDRTGAVWVPGHWSGDVWINGYWRR